MNNIILNYLLKNYLKSFLIVLLIFYCFGIILNLFEEVEFFKNTGANIFMPLLLTIMLVPSLIIKLLPFVLFISSIWFLVKIRNNKELLTLKVYGYSNLKIFFILAFTSFLLGWFILIFINPVTSSFVKYYEKTKSNYARDIDHLVTVNKNGLWIKENFNGLERIITSSNPQTYKIKNVKIFEFNKNFNLNRKIVSDVANIESKNWILKNVEIYSYKDGIMVRDFKDSYSIESIYNYEKIVNLFNNSDTFSFLDISINFNEMLNKGYNKIFLKQSLHSMMTLPFYLFVMAGLAAILALHTMKASDNLKFIVSGLIFIILIYYFKDLSLALGKTSRIPLILSIWTPVMTLSFFTFVGIIQINEK
tara:strand:+ start:36 stop:1124 length:1089 start_codon:yes stop_codon:yes gene_type:complete